MGKQGKQLLVLVIVLVLLVAGYFGLRQYNQSGSEEESEEDVVTVVDITQDDVVRLSYDYEGETYHYDKVDGVWYYTDDHSLELTQYLVKNMVSMIAPLEAQQVIENVTDMTQYGLADSDRTINFETENASYVFKVGDYNSVSGVRYICKPSENTVYAVSSGVVSIFDKTLEDLLSQTEDTTAEETAD